MAERSTTIEQTRAAMRAGQPEVAVQLFETYISAGGQLQGPERVNAAGAYAMAGDAAGALKHLCGIVDAQEPYPTWLAAARALERLPESAFATLPKRVRSVVLGTWNTSEFVRFFRLAAARCGVSVSVKEPPFGQYFNFALDPASALYKEEPDVVILCPDYRATGFAAFSQSHDQALDEELQRWQLVWDSIRRHSNATIIQQGFAIPGFDEFGHLGAGLAGSPGRLLRELNLALAGAARAADIGFVDTDAIAAQFGKAAWFDDRNWHWAKIALSSRALPALARHTAAVLAARFGLSRRCLVLDLDNTLWGGVIGDDGLGGIRLGNGPDGEAYQDFQRAIKSLASRGVVLAACSKNDPQIAREPFLQHPEMILKLEDFAAFEASWAPKSSGIERIARILDLGLSSLTFADDNAYEREQVRAALPAVDLIALPDDPAGFSAALAAYPYFELPSFTAEDRNRGQQYRARTAARQLQEEATTLEEYQARLNMVATIGPVDGINLDRVVQLINKTNQFNLTTRRRNSEEVVQLLSRADVDIFQVRLRDCFADHGIVAVAIAVQHDSSMDIDTLLMSCRVIGRELERVILNEISARAKGRGCNEILGTYIPTDRNALVADLYSRLGFESVESRGQSILWRRPTEYVDDYRPFIAVECS
ncbi:MAG: HAD-IIIC family phosphatase [Pirellulaceae bacterium]